MSEPLVRLTAALSSRYRLDRELGQGGMATVYLAHDLRNNRPVALKVLRPELAAILGAERFLKEIETTANLQHPHILPLFDSGRTGGDRAPLGSASARPGREEGADGRTGDFLYYVMPYVEGESLRDRLNREKQLPIPDALRIATEVASALDYAHRRGILHRDIKPENILLHDGQALVADFGIALAMRKAGGARLTETGLSLGTPQYMSPEQATAERELDARTDIYALGAVTYEMLTGEPPFMGNTTQAIIAKLMTEAPRPPSVLRTAVSPAVEGAVLTALEKLPADRFASAAEFVRALTSPPNIVSPTVRRGGTGVRPSAPLPLLAALIVFAALAAWGWLRPGPSPAPPERVSVEFGAGAQASDADGSPVALSPDGSRIVYVGVDSQQVPWLFSRELTNDFPKVIPGTRGATQPFFAPGGRSLGFLQDGKLRRLKLAEGAAVTICDAPLLQGASWGSKDTIAFAAGGKLLRVPAAGGTPDTIAATDSLTFRWPELLPDGHTIVLTVVDRAGQPSLATISLRGGEVRPLGQTGMSPHYIDAGYLLFGQTDGSLFAAPFDAGRRRFSGAPEQVADNVRFGGMLIMKLGVSRSGSIAYFPGSLWQRDLLLLDRAGRGEPLPIPQARYLLPRFSHDGRRIAVTVQATGLSRGDIWVYDFDARNLTRLTFDTTSIGAEWTPDDRQVASSSGPDATRRIVLGFPADGSGTPETLLVREQPVWEVQFTPDSRAIVFREGVINQDIWMAPAKGGREARPLVATPFQERGIALSPDGRWLAYISNETGNDEIYVRELAEGGARRRISPAGGTEPRWSRNELYFRHGDTLYTVAISPGPPFHAGQPRALFAFAYPPLPNLVGYDVSRDGTRFVVVRGQSVRYLNLVLHRFDRRREASE